MIKTDNKKKIFILLCGITIIIMSDSLMTKLMTLIMHSMSSSRKNVMATPKNVLKEAWRMTVFKEELYVYSR